MKLILCYDDTRNNNEDFALTPYLSIFNVKEEHIHIYGLGLCWGYWNFGFGITNWKTHLFINLDKLKNDSSK